MSLRSSTENENANFVMPAWIAGIHHVRKDDSGDIRVSLIPALHVGDAIEGVVLEVTEVPSAPVFSKNAGTKIYGRKST